MYDHAQTMALAGAELHGIRADVAGLNAKKVFPPFDTEVAEDTRFLRSEVPHHRKTRIEVSKCFRSVQNPPLSLPWP